MTNTKIVPHPHRQIRNSRKDRKFQLFQRNHTIWKYQKKGTRSHHQWGARYGRRREQMRQRSEPGSLRQLEELATNTVALMEKYAPKSENNFSMAMQLLRMQHNLNFAMVCDSCHGTHNYDELVAPER